MTARQIVDRLDALEMILAAEGLMVTSSTGVRRVHPAVPEHRQLAATLPKVLAGIVVGDSIASAKDPTKQRAANARWARQAQLRETQLRRAGLSGADDERRTRIMAEEA